jgi:hypothetical protein
MNYYRACPVHLNELEEDEDSDELRCPEGHLCKTWLTKSDSGKVVGVAHVTKNDMKTKKRGYTPAKLQKFPGRPCKYGHTEWGFVASQGRWRCRACNRERQRRK